MRTVVADGGHYMWKLKTADGTEESFLHAIHQLTESDYQGIVTRARGKPPVDYIRVNGIPYVVGNAALDHGVLSNRSGAARYTKDYYGVFVAAALVRLYEQPGEVAWFGSHPPGDSGYADDLIDSALGHYHVETQSRELWFKVIMANTFDEPRGGLMNVALTSEGFEKRNSEISRGRCLTIDIGEGTTDFMRTKTGGEPDYGLNVSLPLGIGRTVEDFADSFKSNNRDLFKRSTNIPADIFYDAIKTGCFQASGRDPIPCENEAREATSRLLNEIVNAFQKKAGGPAPYSTIVLTGGGAAMLYERLAPVLDHGNVVLADSASTIHMANVRGGLKLWRLYEHLGLVEYD